MTDNTWEYMYNFSEDRVYECQKDEMVLMMMSMHVKRREMGEGMIYVIK